MSLTFGFFISAGPLHSGAQTAFEFLQAVLAKGHDIKQVFFYGDGVHHGNRLIHTENPELIRPWQQVADHHAIPLLLCSASAARRGIMDASQAHYFLKDTNNIAAGFAIAGLAQWFAVAQTIDRILIFGDRL
jgi:tRNA 2-thiouridine synthesizing protein D